MTSLTGRCARKYFFSRLVLTFLLSGLSFSVSAFNVYLDDFNTNYNTQVTRLNTCGLCHYDFNGGGTRTPYGEDFRLNGYSAAAIGSFDSDGDGFTNDQEANAITLTLPGLSCVNLNNVLNAPADVADYADPGNLGCVGPGLPPVVVLNGPYSQVRGQPVTLSSAGSFDPDGTIVSYLWNFGAGLGTSTEPNPTVIYDVGFEARIVVTLTVTDNDGNSATGSTSVYSLNNANLPPVADPGPTVTGTVNAPATFDGSASSDPEGLALTAYDWVFGDGTTGVGISPNHTYARCGNYSATLTVTDSIGLTGSASTTAVIVSSGIDIPTANAGGGIAGHYEGTLGANIQFDGSLSSDPDCDIVNYSWDFGDGNFGSGMNPVHNYALPGDYVVNLIVTDNDGLVSAASTATVTIIDTGLPDGAALYDTNCGGCHGFGSNSTKIGATVDRINTGITSVATMNSLSSLSAVEVQAISDYLISLALPPPPPGGADGATLYEANCASCHGSGTGSTKIGATVDRINAGITSVASMNFLGSVLTTTDVQAISDYLISLAPPPGGGGGTSDGAALYDVNCASCHGPGDNSTKAGATVDRINNGINSVSSMNFLSGVLTVADVQAIADFLATSTTPTGGEGLYLANCGACHGSDGSGGTSGEDVRGDSTGDIQDAIEKESEMQFLGFLTDNEIQQISDFLNGISSPPTDGGGNDGATLWANSCAGCHGSDPGAKAGATVSRINGAISNDSVTGMGFLANTLSSTEIQILADYLAEVAPPTTPYGLYTAYCASCHGADGSGGSSGENVVGESAGGIQDAIENESEMRYLDFLDSGEVQLISDFLNGDRLPPTDGTGSGGGGGTPDGQALYEANCAGCHGYGENSTKIGATADRINTGISSESQMTYLGTILSAADVQAISDYLVSLSGVSGGGTGGTGGSTGDGATLYEVNCSGCHGPGDNSAKAGATVDRINNGINSVSSMTYLSDVLTAADVQAIADFLNTSTAPTSPEGLYVTYCAACHGTDARGGSSGEDVRGESVSGIKSAIRDEQDMQYLNFLTDEEINAISNYLDSLDQERWAGWAGWTSLGTSSGSSATTGGGGSMNIVLLLLAMIVLVWRNRKNLVARFHE